jgi:hypothetical protein
MFFPIHQLSSIPTCINHHYHYVHQTFAYSKNQQTFQKKTQQKMEQMEQTWKNIEFFQTANPKFLELSPAAFKPSQSPRCQSGIAKATGNKSRSASSKRPATITGCAWVGPRGR